MANATDEKVGFIGLGTMGSHMSRHLIKNGRKLVVFDLNPKAMSEAEQLGAEKASSIADLAPKCRFVVTMLPEDKHVLEVYTGENGVLSNVKSGTYLIDSSTIDPETAREVSRRAAEKGAIFVDAPVTGAIMAAKAGTLNFLCGGRSAVVDAVRELLLCMGKNVVQVGDVGAGCIAKICNNLMVAISTVGISEALNLADNLGLDPKQMTQILNISSGRCWVSEIYNPVPNILESAPSSNDYQPGFATELMAKDTSLAAKLALRSKSALPLGSVTQSIYRIMAQNQELKDKDFSIVYQFLKNSEKSKH